MKIIALSAPGPAPDPGKMDEFAGEEAAETALSRLPFYRHGFVRPDPIPVGPFTSFEPLYS